jgi:glucokinase
MSRGLDRQTPSGPAGPENARWLGVDIGGTNIKWAVLDDRELVESGAVPTARDGEHAVVAQVAELINHRAGGVAGTGITVPGHVDARTGRTGIVPNLPGQWRDFPLGPALTRATGQQVALLNDARAFALAELRLGAASDLADAVFVAVGTGVGGAVALDGNLLGGVAGRVGEVGHVSVVPDGPPCGCGGRGCVDATVGGAALVSAARAAVEAGAAPLVERRIDGDPAALTPAVIFAAAADGDRGAAAVVGRASVALAGGVTSVCALLGISNVVLGGGLARGYPGLVDIVARHLRAVAPLIGPSTVRLAHFTDHSAAIGAALRAQEQGAAGGGEAPGAARGGEEISAALHAEDHSAALRVEARRAAPVALDTTNRRSWSQREMD